MIHAVVGLLFCAACGAIRLGVTDSAQTPDRTTAYVVRVDGDPVGHAFVISHKRGLMATAGHVADAFHEGKMTVSTPLGAASWPVARDRHHPAIV